MTKDAKPDAAQYLAFLTTPEAKADFRTIRFPRADKAKVVTTLARGVFHLSPDEWTAVELSLRVSIVATAFALPFGIALGWLLARKDFWGKTLLDGIIYLPLVLPPVVTGYLLLVSFGRRGPIGALLADNFGLVFSFRWTGAALACGVMGFPLMVRPIRLALEAIDRRLEDAAATLGANRFWVFLTVTLPLALPGIIAGAVMAFARALGEFGATITFVSNIPGETQTISAGHLHFAADSRRGSAGDTPGADRDRALARRADRFRVVRAPRRHAVPGRVTVLAVDALAAAGVEPVKNADVDTWNDRNFAFGETQLQGFVDCARRRDGYFPQS